MVQLSRTARGAWRIKMEQIAGCGDISIEFRGTGAMASAELSA
jgi:hypothetical protein